jgi:hypothetical protein
MWLAALVGLGCSVLAPASHAASDHVFVERVHVLGGATALWGCPDVLIPPAGDCDETFLIFANDARVIGGGAVPRHSSPWWVYVETTRVTYDGIHADAVDWFSLRSGYLEGLPEDALDVDNVHLGSASLDVSIPMDDGTVYDFQGTWRATGERQHFGNDGPNNEGFPVHYNDSCFTTNNHPHQDFRAGEMTGTLNGSSVHSYTFAPELMASIFDGHYLYQSVTHGG